MSDKVFLRTFFHFPVTVNFRPLLDCDVYPLGDGRTPARLRIDYCQGILKHMQSFKQLRPSEIETGSLITLYFLHMGVFSLIPILNADSASQEPFTESCGSVFQLAFTWPVATIILRRAEAFSEQLGVSLPPDSPQFFSNAFDYTADGYVPIGWAIP